MYSGEYGACDVTLSVYPHQARLKNMPDHGGNRTYDLWNTHRGQRYIFQACPVWIYTQSNITSIIPPLLFLQSYYEDISNTLYLLYTGYIPITLSLKYMYICPCFIRITFMCLTPCIYFDLPNVCLVVLFHFDRDLWLPNRTCNCFGICVDNQSGILYACRLLLKYITLRYIIPVQFGFGYACFAMFKPDRAD